MTRALHISSGWLLVTLSACAVVSGAESDTSAKGEWRQYSGTNASIKYSPLDQINRSNVMKLRVAWRHAQIGADFLAAHPGLRVPNSFRATPIMASGVLYATDAMGMVEAFDPETGRTLWRQKTTDSSENTGVAGAIRAVGYWKEGREARILTYQRKYLYALDPKTGQQLTDFGDGGRVDLSENGQYTWNAPPLIIKNLVVVGSPMVEQDSASRKEGTAGDVRAFDVRTR